MENEIRLKTQHERLTERITLCVDSELKNLYDHCMKFADVQEGIRSYLKQQLPRVLEKL